MDSSDRWDNAHEVVELIRNGAIIADSPSLVSAIQRATRCDRQRPCQDLECAELRDYMGRKAASRGAIDVLELIAFGEGDSARHRFGWTVANRAARARQFAALQWLLDKDQAVCEFYPQVAATVAATGNVNLLAWIYAYDSGERSGERSGRRVYHKGLLAAAVGAPDPVVVLEWIRSRWPGWFQSLCNEELTASILNDRSLLHRCIPALEWLLTADGGACRLSLDELTTRLVAMHPESTSVFRWLYRAEERNKGAQQRQRLFARRSAVQGAVHVGNIPLLELVDSSGEARSCILDPATATLAARYGQVCALRWLVRRGNLLATDVTACAFAYGQLDVLNYLYFEKNAPFGCWSAIGGEVSVDPSCRDFYDSYAEDWARCIYRPLSRSE